MKTPIHEQFGCRRDVREIELAPDSPGTTRKDSLRTGPVSMKVFRQMQNFLEVFDGMAVSCVSFQLLQRLTKEVLCQNSFFAMGLVLRRPVPEKKNDGQFGWRLGCVFRKLTHVFTANPY